MAGIKGAFVLTGDLFDNISTMTTRAPMGIRIYCETAAKHLEGEAKKKAPWTDRTGQARQRLTAYVTEFSPGVCEITIAHGVWYGVFLELAHEKKYATIMPTIKQESKEVLKGFKILIGDSP